MDEPAAPENPVAAEKGTCDPVSLSQHRLCTQGTGLQRWQGSSLQSQQAYTPALPLICSPWRWQLQTWQRCPQPCLHTLYPSTAEAVPRTQAAADVTEAPTIPVWQVATVAAARHANLEAPAATRDSATSSRGGGGWKCHFSTYRGSSGLCGGGVQTWDTAPPTGKKGPTYQLAELLGSKFLKLYLKKKGVYNFQCASREKTHQAPWKPMVTWHHENKMTIL